MTRINTNVSSLQAQINLSRNNEDLQTALTRLSTGLRINSGKDDPAGLIASETLRSDIKATEVGISNSQRANQMIATADSALGQVSSLLIDIRGLVNEAANSGAMSAAQIAANQLQVDSSLDAIDRISQITQFQGSRLIDGSLDFTTDGVSSSSISSVQIDQASFGTNPSIGVNVELLSQASKGSLTYSGGTITDSLVLNVGGTEGFQAFSFDAGTTVSQMASAINLVSDATGVTAEASGLVEWNASAGIATVNSFGANNDIAITANTKGEAASSYYVRYFQGASGATTTAAITEAEVDATTGEITYGYIDVTLGTTAAGVAATYDNVVSGMSQATNSSGIGTFAGTNVDGTYTWTASNGTTGTGNVGGPTITVAAGAGTDGPNVAYDSDTSTYAVTLDTGTIASADALETLLNSATGGEHQFDFSSFGAGAIVATDAGTNVFTTAGQNGYVASGAAPVISAVADAAGKETTPMSIVFTNGTAANSYAAATNTYTINIDNDGGEFSMTATELVAALDAIGAGAHDFDTTTGSTVFTINATAGDVTLIDGGIHATNAGLDAGDIDATGTEVIDAINAAQDAMIVAGDITARLFTVGNASGSDGSGIVGISEVVATTGSDSGKEPTANNLLQFQALEGMRDIKYVASGTNTALSIDLTSDPGEYAQAAAIIDLGFANGTFELKAKEVGQDGNQDVKIAWGTTGDATTTAVWDEANSLLVINVANAGATDVNDVINAINSSATAGGVFDAGLVTSEYAPGTLPTVGDGTGAIATDLSTVSDMTVSLEGGVASKGTMVVNLATDANGNVTTTANDLIAFIEASDEQVLKDFELQVMNGGTSNGTGLLSATTTAVKFDAPNTTYTTGYATGDTHAANGSAAQFTITAQNKGSAYDDVLVRVALDTSLGSGESTVAFDTDSNTLLVSYNGAVTANAIVDQINTDTTLNQIFAAEATAGTGGGTGSINDGDFVRLSGGEVQNVVDGETATGTAGAPMVQLLGGQDAGQDVSDAMLTFSAKDYGSSSYVSVKEIGTTGFSVKNSAGATADRSYGTDVSVRINGLQAVGDGLNASLSTASLQMQLGINANMVVGTTSSFSITGGGAQFQLGPDVVSNQQARIGIMSVSSSMLGGINGHGRLFEIREGEGHDLDTDATGAAAIVEDVITQVTGLRGRLGAFQKTTLETNIASLEDTLETLTAAESSIRDADFAEESSALTRAQILVQSGTKVLSIANQQPQNVLSLIG